MLDECHIWVRAGLLELPFWKDMECIPILEYKTSCLLAECRIRVHAQIMLCTRFHSRLCSLYCWDFLGGCLFCNMSASPAASANMPHTVHLQICHHATQLKMGMLINDRLTNTSFCLLLCPFLGITSQFCSSWGDQIPMVLS